MELLTFPSKTANRFQIYGEPGKGLAPPKDTPEVLYLYLWLADKPDLGLEIRFGH